jgi:acetylornithine deacetylase
MTQAMSTVEKDVLAFIDAHEAEVLEFARTLIATPSVNPPGDERAVADLVVDRLNRLGIADVLRVGKSEERPNLVVRVTPPGAGRTLILSGHLDTKPAGDRDQWKTDPWDPVLSGGKLIGLGSGDMKVAVAAMVYAAGAVKAAGGFVGGLTLVFTADEEAGSIFGSRWLAESGHLEGDAAIIGEPSGITREWESVHLISRGAALFRVKVFGTQMHSSVSDRLPSVNATVKMARLIDRMDRELKSSLTYRGHPLGGRGPTVNVGVMAKAGVFYGVYPGYAEFACDIRTLPGMTEAEMRADLQRFLDKAMAEDSDLRTELAFEIWVPATEISPSEPVVQVLLAAAESVLGTRPSLDAFPGATDAPHFQLTAAIPTVAAFGPGLLPAAHSPNESLAASSAGVAARIYALAAARFK